RQHRLRSGRMPQECAALAAAARSPGNLAQGFGTLGRSLTLVPKLSAGLLLYRVRDGVVEVLIAHPGGPFWARKDDGAWSIPKGEYVADEDPWAAAQREFEEELGSAPP